MHTRSQSTARSFRFPRTTTLRSAIVTVALLAAGAASVAAQELAPAMEAFRAGNWSKAAEISANVKPDSPDFAKAQYVCGETLLILGDASTAEGCFRRVLEKNKDAVPALVGLGRTLTAQDKAKEAEPELARAVKLDPKDALAVLALGQAHLALKKTKEAKSEMSTAYELDPKNPLVVRGWCEWLWAENDNAKATKVAQDLSKSQPKHPMGPFLEGLALERDGKDAKAIEAYEEALKRDPSFLDAHKNLAILCHTRNPVYTDAVRTQKSLEHYERYFALGGKDPELEHLYKQFKGFMDESMKGSGGGKGDDKDKSKK